MIYPKALGSNTNIFRSFAIISHRHTSFHGKCLNTKIGMGLVAKIFFSNLLWAGEQRTYYAAIRPQTGRGEERGRGSSKTTSSIDNPYDQIFPLTPSKQGYVILGYYPSQTHFQILFLNCLSLFRIMKLIYKTQTLCVSVTK